MTARARRGLLVVALVALLVPTATACDQAGQVVDQAKEAARSAASSATADAAAAAIGSATTTALQQAGIRLVAPPDCTSDLSVDAVAVTASGTVTCIGRTTDAKAVRAEFDGSLSPASCIGTLTIDVQGREPITVPRIDGCRIAQVLGGAGEGATS